MAKPEKIEELTQEHVWSMSKVDMKQLVESTVARALGRWKLQGRTPDAYELFELHSALSSANNGLYVLALNHARQGFLYDGPVVMNRFEAAVRQYELSLDTLKRGLRYLTGQPVQEPPIFMRRHAHA
jgi:hypothetical protein